jgi:CheY-like chemotaxis protein
MVLVVDDNRELCEDFTEFLSFHGYVVQCAAFGSEALRLLAASQTHPGLILLDVEMPVLDGWGFLAERGKDPRLADVPVVIVSGYRDVAQRAKEAGAIAVMRKPVEPQPLLRLIEQFEGGVKTEQ